METLSTSAGVHIREDLAAAHARAWQRVVAPGTWWTGAERVAIAGEARRATSCGLCRERKAALSPEAVSGSHDNLGALPDPAIDAIHRIRSDPGRLTRTWLTRVLAAGLTVEQYVEIVDVVAEVVAIDTFTHGMGIALTDLPGPVAGPPTCRRPKGARPGGAWVPWLELEDASPEEATMYPAGRPPANIYKAMSLVPAAVHGFFDLAAHQYLPGAAMRDFSREYRAISHAQIELLAGRVSAINRCLY